jgi:hypothetical protein
VKPSHNLTESLTRYNEIVYIFREVYEQMSMLFVKSPSGMNTSSALTEPERKAIQNTVFRGVEGWSIIRELDLSRKQTESMIGVVEFKDIGDQVRKSLMHLFNIEKEEFQKRREITKIYRGMGLKRFLDVNIKHLNK